MTYTLQQVSDRLEIAATLTTYALALDLPRWELFDDVFAPNAVIEFSGPSAEPVTTPDRFRARLTSPEYAPERFSWQHLLRNSVIELDKDSAHVTTEYDAISLERTDDPHLLKELRVGGWYEDDLVRTAAGWRISRKLVLFKRHSTRIVDYGATDASIAALELIETARTASADAGAALVSA